MKRFVGSALYSTMFGLSTRHLNMRRPSARVTAWGVVMVAAVTVSACTAGTATPTQDSVEFSEAATIVLPTKSDATEDRPNLMFLRNFCMVPDPAMDASVSDRTLPFLPLVTEIHAGLTKIDETEGSRVEPDLAESWSVADGGSRYDFRLRDGLKFSDGSSLTASDVK